MPWLRPPRGRPAVSLVEIVAGVLALGLLVYLFVALLAPEVFE